MERNSRNSGTGLVCGNANIRESERDRQRERTVYSIARVQCSEGDYRNFRYWDLYENKFLRYFKGHTSPVVNLEVHPYEDIFISSGADNLILLWDLRKDHAIAKIPTTASPFATFDNQGLIFAASAGKQKVHLFDTKNFDKGEFASFKLSSHINDPSAKVTSLKFSPCGKSLLVSTNKGQMFSVDSFSGEVVARYAEMENVCGTLLNSESMAPISPSFTPDSQYVICGAPDGNVYVWNAFASDGNAFSKIFAYYCSFCASLLRLHCHFRTNLGKTDCRLVTKLEGHTAYPRFARFSPTLLVLASACKDLALWIPRMPGGA